MLQISYLGLARSTSPHSSRALATSAPSLGSMSSSINSWLFRASMIARLMVVKSCEAVGLAVPYRLWPPGLSSRELLPFAGPDMLTVGVIH